MNQGTPTVGNDVQALTGVKVIDISSFLAGPFCATQLAEFGAEVVKVEQPRVGDACRRFGSMSNSGHSFLFASENRNKKSITLDLKDPQGSALLKALVAQADVLVENFQPGTLEGWGLGWEELSAVNPRLIMVRISGFGQTGPYHQRPGFGRIGNAFSGFTFLTGDAEGPPVTPGTAQLADYMSGIYGAMGALLALQARERTGKGQVVDVGLYEPMFRMLDDLAASYQQHGVVRQRMGAANANVVPHSHYPTKDGKWVAIACSGDKLFARLAEAIDQPEVAAGGKWETNEQRLSARSEVDRFVADWTASLSRDEVLAMCDRHQVPCGPVYAIDDIFSDAQFEARQNIAWIKDDRFGELAVPNVVPRMSATPGRIKWLAPQLGEHTDDVLRGVLGVSAERVRELRERGTI